MATPWLLIALMGLTVIKVFCKPQDEFAAVPALPTTGVGLFLGIHNRTLPNYGMIAARDFAERDGGTIEAINMYIGLLDGLNDGLWCQSANGIENIGSWKFPNGSDVPDDLDAKPIHMAHNLSQVGLLRSGSIGSSPYQGMYTCTIPDEKGVVQTLVVWAAGNNDYDAVPNPVIDSEMLFQLMTALDVDPPEFTLSFNVRVAPPTYVMCTPMNLTELSREVTSGQYQPSSTASPVTNVTVTLRTRKAGNYQCTVSVYRASGSDLKSNMSSINISVTSTPTNVSSVRAGLNTVQVSWLAPANNTPPVAGYEVFYALSDNGSAQSGGTTSNTSATLIILSPQKGDTYEFFVVAYSEETNSLPSEHSNKATIDFSIPFPDPLTTVSTMESTSDKSSPGEMAPTASSPSTTTTIGTTSMTSSDTPITDESTGSSNIPIIAGVMVAVVFAIIIIITIVMIVLWRFRNKSRSILAEKKPHSVQFSRMSEKEDEVKLVPCTVPVIKSFPDTTTVEVGQQVKFNVCVTGTPKPSYQWYHYDQLVQEDYAHEVTKDGCLIVVTAEEKHKGTYKLVAENSAGIAERSVVLIVVKDEDDEGNAAVVSDGDTALGQLPLEAIPVVEFGQYVSNCHADNHKGFRSLYWSLASAEDKHSVTVAITPANKPLNRFGNITVYDDNRIVLKPIRDLLDCQHDYINASYIDGYTIHQEYIATQGPMTKTLVDFWRLVWQEKPQTIVMVTNLKEGDKVKCQQYWPEVSSENYGPFSVTLIEQQVFPDYTCRTLQVKLSDSYENLHHVHQYHFTSWPDHGVPEYATSILTLHRQIKQNHKPKKGPMLIHCSAGVGRTGTFLAIDMALNKIENEQVVDISNIIVKMRQQRMKMVQTVDQFMFIFDAILESITCGDTQIPTAKLRQALDQLNTIDFGTGKTGFQQQFDVLTQVTLNPAQIKHNMASQYPKLNRTLEFPPPDKHRVPLKECTCDYINATFVNGYKQKKAFIITQSPMEITCNDFWKMVVQRGCGVIVMLCHIEENGQETCAQYWPSVGDSKVFSEYLIEIQNEVEYPGFSERTLLSTEKASGNIHKVIQFHVTNWTCSGHCSNLQTIVSVQEEMYKVQRRTGNNPVVVHCSNTVGRSGMFCSIATAIDRCKTEGLVDVFQVVKAQRIQKPGLVQDVEQYQLVFDAILAFLDSFDMYTNFQ